MIALRSDEEITAIKTARIDELRKQRKRVEGWLEEIDQRIAEIEEQIRIRTGG